MESTTPITLVVDAFNKEEDTTMVEVEVEEVGIQKIFLSKLKVDAVADEE